MKERTRKGKQSPGTSRNWSWEVKRMPAFRNTGASGRAGPLEHNLEGQSSQALSHAKPSTEVQV